MKTGIKIEAPRIDAEGGAAIAGIVGEILQIGANTRTSEAVMLAAFSVLEKVLPTGHHNLSLTDIKVDGRTQT